MSDEVVWFQPAYGSTYHSGQKIPVSWRSPHSDCHCSFRLCMSNALSAPQSRSEDGSASRSCGTATWPMVTKQKNGTCAALLDPPSVQKEQTYVLQMENEAGSISESPYFSLTSSRPMSAPASANEQSPDQTSALYKLPEKSFAPDLETEHGQAFLPILPSAPESSTHTGVLSPLSARNAASDSTLEPSTLLSPNGPNTVAFAVPLGLVLCVALVAVVLAVRHYRKRIRHRTTDTEKLATLSRFSSRDSTYKAPLEYPANAALPPHVPGPVPLFMPVDLDAPEPVPETRRAPRKTVPVSSSYTNVNVLAQGEAKPARGPRPLMMARENVDIQRSVGGETRDGVKDTCGQSQVALSDRLEGTRVYD